MQKLEESQSLPNKQVLLNDKLNKENDNLLKQLHKIYDLIDGLLTETMNIANPEKEPIIIDMNLGTQSFNQSISDILSPNNIRKPFSCQNEQNFSSIISVKSTTSMAKQYFTEHYSDLKERHDKCKEYYDKYIENIEFLKSIKNQIKPKSETKKQQRNILYILASEVGGNALKYIQSEPVFDYIIDEHKGASYIFALFIKNIFITLESVMESNIKIFDLKQQPTEKLINLKKSLTSAKNNFINEISKAGVKSTASKVEFKDMNSSNIGNFRKLFEKNEISKIIKENFKILDKYINDISEKCLEGYSYVNNSITNNQENVKEKNEERKIEEKSNNSVTGSYYQEGLLSQIKLPNQEQQNTKLNNQTCNLFCFSNKNSKNK